MIEGFLLGVIVTASLGAALFFFRFWRQTHDGLFLAFAMAFFVEGVNRSYSLILPRPGEGRPIVYFVRLLAWSMIVFAIVWKNNKRQQ